MTSSVQHASEPQSSECPAQPGFRPLPPLPEKWQSLAHAFVAQVRRHWADEAMCDGTGSRLTYGETLLRSLVLGRYLARLVQEDPYVGVLLPPTVPAAVTNLALVLQGKIPINLNYTAGQAMIDSSIKQCGIRHVITSPKVLERFQITPDARLLMLEDVPGQIRKTDKVLGLAQSRLLRLGMLERLIPGLSGPGLDSIATVIFTSGSTAPPRGWSCRIATCFPMCCRSRSRFIWSPTRCCWASCRSSTRLATVSRSGRP